MFRIFCYWFECFSCFAYGTCEFDLCTKLFDCFLFCCVLTFGFWLLGLVMQSLGRLATSFVVYVLLFWCLVFYVLFIFGWIWCLMDCGLMVVLFWFLWFDGLSFDLLFWFCWLVYFGGWVDFGLLTCCGWVLDGFCGITYFGVSCVANLFDYFGCLCFGFLLLSWLGLIVLCFRWLGFVFVDCGFDLKYCSCCRLSFYRFYLFVLLDWWLCLWFFQLEFCDFNVRLTLSVLMFSGLVLFVLFLW